MTNETQLTVFGEQPDPPSKRGYGAPFVGAGKLRYYLEAPIRRPLHVIIPFAIMMALAVGVGFLQPRMFRSATLILVESEKMPDSFVRSMATENTNRRLITIKQEILSRTRLETILSELNPYPHLASTTEGVGLMRNAIEMNVKANDAFSIEYVHNNPRKAQEVTSRLATLFIEQSVMAREQQVEEATDFLESEVRNARLELEVKDNAVREYKERHMGNLPEQTQANLATLQMLQQEQQGLEVGLRDARQRQDLLEKALTDRGTASHTGPPTAPEAGADLAELRSQLLALRGRYTEEHPDVQSLRARIVRLERQLVDATATESLPTVDPSIASTRAQLAKAQLEIRALEGKRADLDERIVAFRARVEQAPRTEQELATLTRDYQKLNEHYLTLLNKKLDAQMAAKLEKRWKGEHFRILDPAHLPEGPYSPNRPLLLSVGLVLGLFLGLGTALAAEFLDGSVKDVDDLQELVPYPVLATIPYVSQVEAASRLLSSRR